MRASSSDPVDSIGSICSANSCVVRMPMSPMIATSVRAILRPLVSLRPAMPKLYRLGGAAARNVNRGEVPTGERAEFEIAPVANRRLHQSLVVPSDDAHRGGVASSLPPFDENRGRSGRKREGLRFHNRLKWCRDLRLALGVRGRGTVPLGLAGGLPLVTACELSHSWSFLGQSDLLVRRGDIRKGVGLRAGLGNLDRTISGFSA